MGRSYVESNISSHGNKLKKKAVVRPKPERNISTHGNKKRNEPSCESTQKAYAKKMVDEMSAEMFADSTIADNAHIYPKFEKSELGLGKVLGRGGFGTVWEIKSFKVNGKTESSEHKEDDAAAMNASEELNMESRLFIAEHCIREGGDSRYAVKVLSPEVVADPPRYLQGILDIAIETHFLSDIEHPHIIKLRATASCSPYEKDYFIVMDRLYDTLENRLVRWNNRFGRYSGMAGRLTDRKGNKAAKLYEERVVSAYHLAGAILFMHGRGIVYRDLKPENIGFDIRDDIKIFDFGLAKELKDIDRNEDGTYNLTEMTGSPRYMAPEVANGKPYNDKCDVYSFSILLWEILALKRPYELYTAKTLREKVYNGTHKRPPIEDHWVVPLKLLLKRSWCQDLQVRNSMTNNAEILKTECLRVRNGDDSGLENTHRKSTFVFRPRSASSRSHMDEMA